MSIANQMPSNRLYRGEVTDFEDAMKAVKSQCEHEISLCGRYTVPVENLEKSLNEMIAAADKCKSEYYARVKSVADALFKEWAESNDETVRLIGEAGLSGDYSGLAI